MLRRTNPGSEHSARPVALTLKGQIAVALIRLERALDCLTEAEQADLAAELGPIVRVARTRAQT